MPINDNRSYNNQNYNSRPSSGAPARTYSGGDRGTKPAGEGEENRRPMTFSKKKFVYRKKECYYTKNRIPYVDYKDVNALKNFVGFSGQILANRFTGLKPIFQRRAAKAIKRARFMALLPFVGEVKKATYRRDGGEGGRGRYEGPEGGRGRYEGADAKVESNAPVSNANVDNAAATETPVNEETKPTSAE